jgi:hypothetical protein
MKRILHTVFGLLPVLLAAQTVKLPVIQKTQFRKDTFNISKFGAIADGNTLNKKVLQLPLMPVQKKAVAWYWCRRDYGLPARLY